MISPAPPTSEAAFDTGRPGIGPIMLAPTWRRIAIVLGLYVALLTTFDLPSASAQAQTGVGAPAEISLAPLDLPVTEGMPSTVTIHLTGGPAAGEFDLVLKFDANVVVPTSVSFGFGGAEAVVQVEGSPSSGGSGRLRLKGKFNTASPQASPGGASVLLATVNLAPVAAGSAAVNLDGAGLRGEDGRAINTITSGSTIATVVMAPSAVGVEGALRQSTALTTTTGFGIPALEGLVGDFVGTLRVQGWTLLWLGVLLTSLALVGVGWLLGRPRPAPGQATSTVRWTRDEDAASGSGVRVGPIGPKP